MQEQEIYSDENIKITNSRIVVNNQSYAIPNISSVKATVSKHHSSLIHWLFIKVALISAVMMPLMAYYLPKQPNEQYKAIYYFIFFGIVYLILKLTKKNYYIWYLVLNISGKDVDVYKSKDKSVIDKLLEAVNQAIVGCK